MLFAELDDAIVRAQTPAARAWRQRMGWPRTAALQGVGGGVSRISVHPGGYYEPNEDTGIPAIIIPCWPGPAPGYPDDIIDLLAWVPSSGNLYTRCGVADVLGEEAIYQAQPCMGKSRPLVVFSDPGAWARAHTWDDQGDHGIVVINWDRVAAAMGHLIGVTDIVAPDIATGQRLRDALRPPPPPRARILVAAGETGVAA